MLRRILFLMLSIFPALGAENEKSSCKISKDATYFLAICADGKFTYAISLYSDGRAYYGEWAGSPHGKGVSWNLEKDQGTIERLREYEPGIFRHGKLIKKLNEAVDARGGCLGPCENNSSIRIVPAALTCVGSWRRPGFLYSDLNGLSVCLDTLQQLEMGTWRDGVRQGEFINFEFTEKRIFHYLYKDGKIVRILSEIPQGPYFP